MQSAVSMVGLRQPRAEGTLVLPPASLLGTTLRWGKVEARCLKREYWEADVQPPGRMKLAPTAAIVVMLGIFGGCRQKPSPVATPADVAAAQHEAQSEIKQAQVEARKDVRSAAKVTGADSQDVARAKVTGAFDIAMAHADGDHKVAIANCMTLEPSAQPACKDKADIDYQSAVTKAKANRVSRQQ
jgi:hypothetical protein